MTPEELGHLLLTSMLAAICDVVLEHHKHHLQQVPKYLHRNVLHWAEPSEQEQTDEMGD